jgi:hypothetical protein
VDLYPYQRIWLREVADRLSLTDDQVAELTNRLIDGTQEAAKRWDPTFVTWAELREQGGHPITGGVQRRRDR